MCYIFIESYLLMQTYREYFVRKYTRVHSINISLENEIKILKNI